MAQASLLPQPPSPAACLFLSTAAALCIKHRKPRAASRILVSLGRYSDAISCATTVDDAVDTIACAPRDAHRALWLQVLQQELHATVQVGADGGSADECGDMLEGMVERSGGELQLEDALQYLPRESGMPAQAARLLRRCCVAERTRMAALASGFEGLGEKTNRRRAALRQLQAGRQVEEGVFKGACAVCRKAVAGAPGRSMPCGALQPTLPVPVLHAVCSSLGGETTGCYPTLLSVCLHRQSPSTRLEFPSALRPSSSVCQLKLLKQIRETHWQFGAGGMIPPVVTYPGSAYHTSCAVYAHSRLTRSSSSAQRWARLLEALAAHDVSAPVDVASAVAARSPQSLLIDLEHVLSRGDPALDVRLLDLMGRTYGEQQVAGAALLALPDMA
jgi:hypothetical protein